MKTAKQILTKVVKDEDDGEYYHKIVHTYYQTNDNGTLLVSEATGYFTGALGGYILDETYIFQVKDDDTLEVTDWCEMEGSQRPAIPAEELMKKLGYEVI